MNAQEIIDRDLRLLIGDLHVQLVFARAQVAELQQQIDAATINKPNGGGGYRPDESLAQRQEARPQ